MALLHTLAKEAVMVFVVSSMLAMGAGLTIGQIVAPLCNCRLVFLGQLANFGLMPRAAVILWILLRLGQSLGVGLLLA